MTGPRSYVVVATAGHYDEEALEAALSGEASYVGLVASPRRGKAVIDYLRGKGVCPGSLDSVKYPAGLDIGAETPEEIALSILTEIVQHMRANPVGIELTPADEADDAESIDPICSMTVKVAMSRYVSNYNGSEVHFCSAGCKDRFEQEPERYPLSDGRVVDLVTWRGRTGRPLDGQYLGQDGHGEFGRGSGPDVEADRRSYPRQVCVAETLLPQFLPSPVVGHPAALRADVGGF